MIVAVIAVRMVQTAVDRIVDVVAVRHGFVPAPSGVRMTIVAVDRLRVTVRMPVIHRDHVLIDVIVVRVVKMPVVEIIDVVVVAHRDVTTPFSVDVRVLAFMNGM